MLVLLTTVESSVNNTTTGLTSRNDFSPQLKGSNWLVTNENGDCGVYSAPCILNGHDYIALYSFFGSDYSTPLRYSSHFIPVEHWKNVTRNTNKISTSTDIEFFVNSTVIEYKNFVLRNTVDSISFYFFNKEELALFNCSLDTPLETYISYKDLHCNSKSISYLTDRIGETVLSPVCFYDGEVSVIIGKEKIVLKMINRSACSSTTITMIALIICITLIGSLIFLLLFSLRKKQIPIIGNGINLKKMNSISKPFSSVKNPYYVKDDKDKYDSDDSEKTSVYIPTTGTRSNELMDE